MRTGLFLFALAFVWVVACTTAKPPDEDCIVNGGICFTSVDFAQGCAHALSNFACAENYYCCTNAFAGNLVCDGSAGCHLVEGGTGIPDNYGIDASGPPDATLLTDTGTGDAVSDAPPVDGAAKDGGSDAVPTTPDATSPVSDAAKG